MAAALAVFQNPTVPSGTLTIDQAAALAEKNAFAVRIQRTTVEKDRQNLKYSQAELGPTVSAQLEYLRNTQAITQSFGSFSAVIQPIDEKTGALNLTLPLDISGNIRRLIRANKSTYQSAKETLRATLEDARLAARTDYVAVLRAQAEIAVSQDALTDANAQLTQAQQQYAQQEIAKVDMLAFETTVDQAKGNLLIAQNDLEIAKETLNAALAIPIETRLDYVDIPELPVTPTDPDPLVRSAQQTRPEVLALIHTIDALANIARSNESTMDPSLSLGVSSSQNFDPLPGDQSNTTVGTLTLNIPLYDSGQTRARVKAARQDEVSAKIQLEQTKLGISQDVHAAIANLISAKARYDNAVSQVGYAKETYRLSIVRQKAGEGTYVEVIDAQNSLTQARNGLDGARYDYLTAYAQLQRAVGADNLSSAAESGLTNGGKK
jgi:outer membrane protein